MLTVTRHYIFDFCLCVLTVPRGTEGTLSALERVIPTLDWTQEIVPTTTEDYPVVRRDLIVPADPQQLHLQIDTTETHFVYTFRCYNIVEKEPVNSNLELACSYITTCLVEIRQRANALRYDTESLLAPCYNEVQPDPVMEELD
jgi:hypothetical protein